MYCELMQRSQFCLPIRFAFSVLSSSMFKVAPAICFKNFKNIELQKSIMNELSTAATRSVLLKDEVCIFRSSSLSLCFTNFKNIKIPKVIRNILVKKSGCFCCPDASSSSCQYFGVDFQFDRCLLC